MEEQYVIIGDTRFYHGDKISAVILYQDIEYEIEDARLCINDLDRNGSDDKLYNLFICQDECDGDSSAKEKFEYRYSWNFKVDTVNKRICSDDTISIKSEEKDREEDDDPMPDDWVCEEKFPEDI